MAGSGKGKQPPADGFHTQLLQDLYNRGLAANKVQPRGQTFLFAAEDTVPHITDIGRLFLTFISSPIPDLDETADEGNSE